MEPHPVACGQQRPFHSAVALPPDWDQSRGKSGYSSPAVGAPRMYAYERTDEAPLAGSFGACPCVGCAAPGGGARRLRRALPRRCRRASRRRRRAGRFAASPSGRGPAGERGRSAPARTRPHGSRRARRGRGGAAPTLVLAPGYADAREALDHLASRRGAAETRAPEAEPRWRLDLDGSHSWLEGSQPNWREGSAQLRYQASERTAVGAGVEVSRRFGETDVYGEVRLEQRASPGTSFYLSAGATPNADFRPRWQIGAGGSARIRSGPSGTVLTLDARQARYRAGDIQTVTPGVEQYVAGGRAWITGRWINIFDENGRHRSGWLARGDVMASDRLRLFAGAADAPDVSEGVVIPTFSVFGGASLDVSRRTTLRFSIAHEDRRTGADRLQASIGMGFRF